MADGNARIRRFGGAALSAAVLCAAFSLGQCDVASLRTSIEQQVIAAQQAGTVATPAFTPTEGTYDRDQAVAASTATEGAEIYYTTDGSTPSRSTAKYAAPVPVAGDGAAMTIKAIAVKDGMNDSEQAQAVYAINYSRVSTPQFGVAPGEYGADMSVTILCGTVDATIRYTTNGDEPDASSTAYTGPVSAAGEGTVLTLKAIAEKAQMKTSTVATATYRIRYQPAQWARTVATSPGSSTFSSIAVDSAGDVCAAGMLYGSAVDPVFTFGTGVTISLDNGNAHMFAAKYGPDGTVQWAKTVTCSPSNAIPSFFNSVATDSAKAVYAVGYVSDAVTYDFGNGVTHVGLSTKDAGLIVKYGASGAPQWADSAATAPGAFVFQSVAVDAADNVYAAGYITGTGGYVFDDKTVTASSGFSGNNAVLVKYNASGAAQWALTVSAGPGASCYKAVATDSDGSIYAAGSINGTGTYGFGNGKTAHGPYAGDNVVLVKYDASGTAQWATTLSASTYTSAFSAVAVDSSKNVYASAAISGKVPYDFGNGAVVTGPSNYNHGALVKYDSGGTAQWARTVSASGGTFDFSSVAVDPSGNAYAAGSINGTGTFDFGCGMKAAGVVGSSNVVLVSYDAAGTTRWARSVTSGPDLSRFTSVAASPSSTIVYAAGSINGIGAFDFGDGDIATGVNANYNIVLVKYGG